MSALGVQHAILLLIRLEPYEACSVEPHFTDEEDIWIFMSLSW